MPKRLSIISAVEASSDFLARAMTPREARLAR